MFMWLWGPLKQKVGAYYTVSISEALPELLHEMLAAMLLDKDKAESSQMSGAPRILGSFTEGGECGDLQFIATPGC